MPRWGEWYGVATNDTGRVTYLGLGVNELNGEIPAELGSLTQLKGLDLSTNPGHRLSGRDSDRTRQLDQLGSIRPFRQQLKRWGYQEN